MVTALSTEYLYICQNLVCIGTPSCHLQKLKTLLQQKRSVIYGQKLSLAAVFISEIQKNTFEWLICVHSAVCVWVRHAGSFAYLIEARYRSSICKSNQLIAVSVLPTLQI